MKLAELDGKPVRLVTDRGEVFEGEASYDSADYCEHEFGRAEDCLEIDHWLFFRHEIAEIAPLAGEARTWLSRRMHRMRLAPGPFRRMEEGKKTVELRLHDPKRRALRLGDVIRFESTADETDILHAEVTALLPFPSFEALYAAVPLPDMGYAPEEEKSASPADMDAYYSRQEQERWGVLAIRVKQL